jgi:hypothetical protein
MQKNTQMPNMGQDRIGDSCLDWDGEAAEQGKLRANIPKGSPARIKGWAETHPYHHALILLALRGG